RPLADLPAFLRLRVAVVDRGPQLGNAERLQRAGLILPERLRRVQVEDTGLRVAGNRIEDGQVERERLAARRAGGDDQMLAAVSGLGGLGLMAVERGDALRDERALYARVEVVRERLGNRSPRRLAAEVCDLLPGKQIVPGRALDRQTSRSRRRPGRRLCSSV